MNANPSATMYESIPVVSELNKVQGFDPLKFLRRTSKGEKVLDLKYKKLWFRLKYPNGRIKLSSLKITDQLAIIEARVYFDKNDAQPRSSFIAQREAKATPGGLYIESAQHAAIDQALSDAGFGVQFSAAATTADAEKAAEAIKEQPTAVSNKPAQEAPVIQKTVAETLVTEVMEETEGEEIEEETADTDTAVTTYSADMPVDEICSMMTYEEAGNVIVPLGTCKGWAMSQVADRRPASLKWYINGYSGNDNLLRAAATIMQASLDEMQRAS